MAALHPVGDAAARAEIQRELELIEVVLPGIERKLRQSRSWVLPTQQQQWRHDRQSLLVDRLRRFAGDDRYGSTRARTAWLRSWAKKIKRETITRYKRAWTACIEQIADVKRFPHYRGLRIGEQLGLVPLGPDPASKLFEFAHWMSGKPPRRSRRDGRLKLEAASGVVLVLLPGGRTRIGADVSSVPTNNGAPPHRRQPDRHAHPREQPAHDVELAPFFLSKYELTQRQWTFLTGERPSEAFVGVKQSGQAPTTSRHPVEMISWEDANKVMARVGLRLPTSSQWEYAARANSTTIFFTGDEPASLAGYCNIADIAHAQVELRQEALYRVFNDGWPGHAPVGSFRANRFGLHDMVGNVMEWTRDRNHLYRNHWLPGEALRPVGDGLRRALRGGSHRSAWPDARSSAFLSMHQKASRNDVGLRPSRALDER